MKKALEHWNLSVPALLFFAVAILLMSASATQYTVRSVTTGVLFVVGGGTGIIGFFQKEDNVFRLLAGVAQLSAAVWMFVTIKTPVTVFCIAIAAIILLFAGGEVYDAVRRTGGWKRIVWIVIAAAVVGACIVVPCDPFSAADQLLSYTGAVLCVFSALLYVRAQYFTPER